MDGSTRQIQVDSSSTAQEEVHQLGKALGIVDIFGFSIYIKLFEKVLCRLLSLERLVIFCFYIYIIAGDVFGKWSRTHYGCHIEL